ncbi:hypothetical protein CDG60_09650 [Acinetobacter chinensis]|uniref:Uncharacterized protein n=1 Tax=Acinetobacter chinensis TaxID=2004650 RepID=A0A3B7LVK0_9GAMM|nr:hypothetical protein CDG60_09650 [Acinetobacter chinensis]
MREKLGRKLDDAPEFSYTAHIILNAFNVISRSRAYEQGVALPLDGRSISAYLELYETPCELHVFVECVFALDNLFLDGVRKKSA